MKPVAWVALVAGVCAAGVVWLARRDNAGVGAANGQRDVARRTVLFQRPAAERVASAPAAAAPAAPADVAPPAPLPASLRDTEVDGALGVDARGGLLVNPETRVFFDYYLSASGEEPLAVLRARLVAAIEARLPAGAAATAVALLDRYLRYREEARSIDVGAGAADVPERFAQIWALRLEVFGAAVAEALFGPEEEHDRAEVERRRVLGDVTLPPTERAQRLAEVDAGVPAAVREAREAAMLPQQLRRDESALRAAGGSDAEVHALREQMVGAEAAARLADLDAERARWRDRVDDYRRERDAINRDPTRSPEQRAGAMAALLAQRFTEAEQRRVAALDRLAAAPTPVLPGLTADRVLGSGTAPEHSADEDVRCRSDAPWR